MSLALLHQLPDERLVALVRSGRDDAFAAIHDRYRERLLTFDRRLLKGSGHDAEDIVQDAFSRALHGLRATDAEMSAALGTSIPATKSLLVRARGTLAEAVAA